MGVQVTLPEDEPSTLLPWTTASSILDPEDSAFSLKLSGSLPPGPLNQPLAFGGARERKRPEAEVVCLPLN